MHRVPVLNGHTATVFINFGKNPPGRARRPPGQLHSKASEIGLPHAPKQFIQYPDRGRSPAGQARDVDYEGGMGVSIGRLREDSIFDWKFVGLARNTLRGAAGGALECAEMLQGLGYITKSDGEPAVVRLVTKSCN